ncbi:hypothetical protein [Paraclostridium dentum]|uniref:hypothetical protein n=1 Tax=Paraclostridium dentum TaxID=2662455 RepID=UPI00051E04A1|nr:hypothetical protein [Paraclostridium dentum]KGJ49710.1 hypothetical protein KD33_07080 [Clostridium sp. NCR]
MIKTNIDIVQFEDIKGLINLTAKKYNNFKDFSVVNYLKRKDKYIVYLNFYNECIECNDEVTQVEVIRNVLHREIETVIKNAENDFDYFIGQCIIENIEKTNFVDVILKYKVNRKLNDFKLAHLKRWSGGYDTKTRISDISFRITSYDPTDTYDLVGEPIARRELYIENNENFTMISLLDFDKVLLLGCNGNRTKDILYFIEKQSDSSGYVISRYGEKNVSNWDDERVIVEEKTVLSINEKDLSDDILNYIQEEFNVVIDIQSKRKFEEELKSIFGCKKAK